MKPPLAYVVEKYRENLYAAIFNVCRNTQDAEDALQETFLGYWARKKEFETEEHLRAWLFRVAINKAKNKRSSVFRRNTVPLEDEMHTLAFATEEASALFEAVMKLPEKYRIVIHLFYYEDYSVRKIADILKISSGNVKTRLSRGRMSLRNTLKEVWQDDE